MFLKVFSLWIQGTLPPIALLSIKSFYEHGIHFDLYCYDIPNNLHELQLEQDSGYLTIKDASEYLPKEEIYQHHTGSWAPFSDWWRFTKLSKSGGTWVDLDCYMLKVPDKVEPYYYQHNKNALQPAIGFLNHNGDKDLFDAMREQCEKPSIINKGDSQEIIKMKNSIANLTPREQRIRAPWAILGPDAFESVINNLKSEQPVIDNCGPEYIYPLSWEQWRRLYNDTLSLEEITKSEKTWMVHLWNDQLRYEPTVWNRMMPNSLMNQLLKIHLPDYAVIDDENDPWDKVDIIIGICSCQPYVARRAMIRETWAKDVVNTVNITKYDFFYGGFPNNNRRFDEVNLSVDDSYNYLPLKCYSYYKYALENYDFKYLFKCDDDTYVVPSRLYSIIDQNPDADLIASNEDFMAGGGGYLMSRKFVETIVNRGCNIQAVGREDDIYGQLAQIYGFTIVRTPYLKQYKKFEPDVDNSIATCHWCNPIDMKRIYNRIHLIPPNSAVISEEMKEKAKAMFETVEEND